MGFLVKQKIEESVYGELDSFYVRINLYHLDKISGNLKLSVGMYLSKELADNSISPYYGEGIEIKFMIGGIIKYNKIELDTNQLLYYEIPIIKNIEIIEDIFEEILVPQVITYYDFNDEGELIEFQKEIEPKKQLKKIGEVTQIKNKIDISSIMTHDFYNYCYTFIKNKFANIFGVNNLEDY